MDPSTLKRVAHLARIASGDDELDGYRSHFDELLAFVDAIKSADTEGVEPLAHPLEMAQRLRDDTPSEQSASETLKRAPETEDDLFLVPRVLE